MAEVPHTESAPRIEHRVADTEQEVTMFVTTAAGATPLQLQPAACMSPSHGPSHGVSSGPHSNGAGWAVAGPANRAAAGD